MRSSASDAALRDRRAAARVHAGFVAVPREQLMQVIIHRGIPVPDPISQLLNQPQKQPPIPPRHLRNGGNFGVEEKECESGRREDCPPGSHIKVSFLLPNGRTDHGHYPRRHRLGSDQPPN